MEFFPHFVFIILTTDKTFSQLCKRGTLPQYHALPNWTERLEKKDYTKLTKRQISDRKKRERAITKKISYSSFITISHKQDQLPFPLF